MSWTKRLHDGDCTLPTSVPYELKPQSIWTCPVCESRWFVLEVNEEAAILDSPDRTDGPVERPRRRSMVGYDGLCREHRLPGAGGVPVPTLHAGCSGCVESQRPRRFSR